MNIKVLIIDRKVVVRYSHERNLAMNIQVRDYVDVEERALALGCNTPTGLTMLPRNFNTANSLDELIHENTPPTIRSLLRQGGVQETRLEKEGEKFPLSARKSWEWVGPIIYIGQWMLTNAALPMTITLISSSLYEITMGYHHDAEVTLAFVVGTIETTKRGKKLE